MEDINFWKENIHPAQVTTNIQNLLRDLDTYDTEIQESFLDNDSREVNDCRLHCKETCCSIKMHYLQRNVNLK